MEFFGLRFLAFPFTPFDAADFAMRTALYLGRRTTLWYLTIRQSMLSGHRRLLKTMVLKSSRRSHTYSWWPQDLTSPGVQNHLNSQRFLQGSFPTIMLYEVCENLGSYKRQVVEKSRENSSRGEENTFWPSMNPEERRSNRDCLQWMSAVHFR